MKRILALLGGEEVAGDVLDPAVRAEFDRADQSVGDEEDEEQERADEKPVMTTDGASISTPPMM